MADKLAVWMRDDLMWGGPDKTDGGLHPGYLNAFDETGFAFNFDGDIDLEKLSAAVREYAAAAIDGLADAEARRSGWDGTPGTLGNWIHGIRESARFVRRGLVDDPLYAADRPKADE